MRSTFPLFQVEIFSEGTEILPPLSSLWRHSGRRNGVESASDVALHSEVTDKAEEDEGAHADEADHLGDAAPAPLHHPHSKN